MDDHLRHCSACQKTLQAYRNIARKLQTAKAQTTTVAVKTPLSSVGQLGKVSPWKRWRNPALFAALVLVIVAIAATCVWQPWNAFNDSERIIARATAAISSVRSYRMVATQTDMMDRKVSRTASATLEFAGPDSYLSKTEGTDMPSREFIATGGRHYLKESGPDGSFGSVLQESSAYSPTFTRQYAMILLESITNIEKLPDETVEGIVCLHYRGVHRSDTSSDGPTTVEFWIGKDDFLLRRMTSDTETPAGGASRISMTDLMTFSDFNAVMVEPPLDQDGSLFTGWSLIAGFSGYPLSCG